MEEYITTLQIQPCFDEVSGTTSYVLSDGCTGELPPKEDNGITHLKIPVDALQLAAQAKPQA